MDRQPTPADTAALLNFNGQFIQLLAEVVVALGRKTDFPDDIRRLVHDRLPALSEAAIQVPERVSALQVFDLFQALFPPPSD